MCATENVPAGATPAPLSVADQAAHVLGDVGDTRAMLLGAASLLDGMAGVLNRLIDSAVLDGAQRLLSIALDRLAETYTAAEALTIALDEAAEVSHG